MSAGTFISFPAPGPRSDESKRSAVRADVRKWYEDFGASMHMHVVRIGGALIKLREYCKDNNELWMAQFPTTAEERAEGSQPDGSKVPFSYRTGMAFVSIAGNAAIANLHHDATVAPSVLPADWNSLYALSRIPAPKLISLIEEGKIQPGMDRAEIHQLCDATLGVSAKRQRDLDDDADLEAHLPGKGLPPVPPGRDEARDIRANADAAGRRWLDDATQPLTVVAETIGPLQPQSMGTFRPSGSTEAEQRGTKPKAKPEAIDGPAASESAMERWFAQNASGAAPVTRQIVRHVETNEPEIVHPKRVINTETEMTIEDAIRILRGVKNCRPLSLYRIRQRVVEKSQRKLKRDEAQLVKAEGPVIKAAMSVRAKRAKA